MTSSALRADDVMFFHSQLSVTTCSNIIKIHATGAYSSSLWHVKVNSVSNLNVLCLKILNNFDEISRRDQTMKYYNDGPLYVTKPALIFENLATPKKKE
jgi:hypothetical protein